RAPPNPLASFFRPTRRSCPSLPSCSLSDGSATRPRRLLVAAAFLPCPHEDVRGAKHVADLLVRHNDVISTSDQRGERHVPALFLVTRVCSSMVKVCVNVAPPPALPLIVMERSPTACTTPEDFCWRAAVDSAADSPAPLLMVRIFDARNAPLAS